ncbi:MAG TPA: pirin family protein [Chloroflexota bacterium]|jgi:redox-sensitive bicupin YhaK (pirin superfamily)|nr:pirin family protein [Chloroflexota bacterium]
MLSVRRSADRGHASYGWLETYHTFSFARYYDPRFNGFRALLVLNQDRVAPGRGFGMHPHENMEILTYVLEGALEHQDTMGFRAVLRPGEVQVISAGTGMAHGEFNPSQNETVHFLQIWIVPREQGGDPAYQQEAYPIETRRNRLCLVGSPDGRDGSTTIRQDVMVYATVLEPQHTVSLDLAVGRYGWVHVATGAIELNGQLLEDGDGAAIADETRLTLSGRRGAEVLLFDLP